VSFSELLRFLPAGYLISVLIETPVLLIGLSARHPLRRKLIAGVWLTVCTYPFVALIFPLAMRRFSCTTMLIAAETFAAFAECVLFWFAFGREDKPGSLLMWRDFGAIVAANLSSFLGGEFLKSANILRPNGL
jgi:hypothetical protein